MNDTELPDAVELVLKHFQVLKVEPGDTLVLMHPTRLSDVALKRLREQLVPRFPDNKIMLLEEDMRFGVIRTCLKPDAP